MIVASVKGVYVLVMDPLYWPRFLFDYQENLRFLYSLFFCFGCLTPILAKYFKLVTIQMLVELFHAYFPFSHLLWRQAFVRFPC